MSYLVKRYAVVAVITMITVAVLGYVIEVFFDHDIGAAGGMIAVFVPAMDAGQAYVRRGHGKPENGFAWKMSLIFMGVNLAIVGVLMSALSAILGGEGELLAIFAELGGAGLAIIIGVTFVLGILLSRFFFGFGAKNQLNLEEKLAAKKQP
ncbi:ABZJ_00895 family protein [uncultured Litoreibacter sp.]|uniref:ABZJ_00895 family protein n=1 Tax=uncultured Litoreibacter sp. TaxID=1392394 RepID=UPI002610A01E|nr:ABZJ_00895 family protein [uncultured Litoreibacter sp.]